VVVAGSFREREFARLEPSHRIEPAVADPSAMEARGHWPVLHGRARRSEFAHHIERVGHRAVFIVLAAAPDRDGRSARDHLEHRPRTHEAESTDLTALLHALEEKARRQALIRGHQPAIRQDGRQLIARQPTSARQDTVGHAGHA